MTETEEVITVAVAVMTLGVVVGGIPFAVRLLWRLFQRLLGGSTWRE